MESGSHAKERILGIGGYGSGKTFAWCKWAEWDRKRNGGKVFVIDTDYTTLRMADEFGDEWLESIELANVNEWEQYLEAIGAMSRVAGPNDLLVIDMIDSAWDAVQSYYIEQVHGKTADKFFLEFKMEHPDEAGSPMSGAHGEKWGIVNKLYAGWMGQVLRWPGHIYAAAPAKVLEQPDRQGKGGDSAELRNAMSSIGVRPKGQKSLGHQFHTVLFFEERGRTGGDWVVSSGKDRSREKLSKMPVEDFVVTYLKGVAGWTL